MRSGQKLIFMGSPDFASTCLQAVADGPHEIVMVYTQPPRRAGRGRALRETPVHTAAQKLGLPVRHPQTLKPQAEKDAFAALEADLAVVVAYGLILPRAVLAAPRLGCINLHASQLPRWRGAAPIQRAIMAGDAETGIDVMQMEAGLDTGPVLARASTPISHDDTAGSLHDRLAALGASLLPATIDRLFAGSLTATPQAEDGVTYAHKIGPDDQRIDWTRPAREIDCQIRGLAPGPGAWFHWTPPGEDAPLRLKALGSRLSPRSARSGEVLDDQLLVACGEGAIRLTRLQRPGRPPMVAAEFLNGTPIGPDAVFE